MRKMSKSDLTFNIVNYTLLSLSFVLFLYPLIYVLSASFSRPSDVITGKMWLFPTSVSFDGYAKIFEYSPLWTGYLNTIIIVVAGTILSLAATMCAGYVLSRDDFVAKKFFMWVFTITMFFGGGLIPYYILVADWLTMRDSLLALIIPSAVSVWNIILIRTYFMTSIPKAMLESAQIDGCGNFRYFLSIGLPLAVPIIAVITLYNVVGRWNSYFDALIFLNTPEKYPLQLVIRNLLSQNQMSGIDSSSGVIEIENMMRIEAMKYGVIVVSSLPMLIIYPFVQKYFIKGIMVGSLKG